MNALKPQSVSPPLLRIGPLTTMRHVREELAKVYKDARRGKIDTQDASRLAFVLMSLGKLLQQMDVDERLSQLTDQELMALIDAKIRSMEARTNGRPAPPPEPLCGSRPSEAARYEKNQ